LYICTKRNNTPDMIHSQPVSTLTYLACSKPYKSAADDSTTDPSPMFIRLPRNGSWKQRNHDPELRSLVTFPSFCSWGDITKGLVLHLTRWWNRWHPNMTRSWVNPSSKDQSRKQAHLSPKITAVASSMYGMSTPLPISIKFMRSLMKVSGIWSTPSSEQGWGSNSHATIWFYPRK